MQERDKRLVTLALSSDLESVLNRIGHASGQSKTEVIRNALNIMMQVTRDVRAGPSKILNESFEREILNEERRGLSERKLVALVPEHHGERPRRGAANDLTSVPRNVFISYAREDVNFAATLYSRLKKRGHNPWLDKHNLKKGSDWQLEVRKAISEADFFVAILSQNSVGKRGFVQVEVHEAAQQQLQRPEGVIYMIPFKVDNCEVPSYARKFNYVDLSKERAPYKSFFRTIESAP